MKRYTFFTDDYPVVTCDHCYEDQNENCCGPAIERLAEYEATGLMPAEVAALQYQLRHARGGQRWIPAVPQSMPKLYEPVLVKYLSYNDGTASPTNVDVAVLLDENAWYWWEGDVGDCDEDAKCTITHWMPLPKEKN